MTLEIAIIGSVLLLIVAIWIAIAKLIENIKPLWSMFLKNMEDYTRAFREFSTYVQSKNAKGREDMLKGQKAETARMIAFQIASDKVINSKPSEKLSDIAILVEEAVTADMKVSKAEASRLAAEATLKAWQMYH
jgi:hypothetical protein